jgi:hypothetical protein
VLFHNYHNTIYYFIYLFFRNSYTPTLKEKFSFSQNEINFILEESNVKLINDEYIHSARFTHAKGTGFFNVDI